MGGIKTDKKKDIPNKKELQTGITVNKAACISCNLCTKTYSKLFKMKNKKTMIKDYDSSCLNRKHLDETMEICPIKAIENMELK